MSDWCLIIGGKDMAYLASLSKMSRICWTVLIDKVMEPTKILVATTNNELFNAFKQAFMRFDVQMCLVSSYCEAVEQLQNGCTDLLISDYFLGAGAQKDVAFEARNWEVDTIEHDLKIVGLYRNSLLWLRNLIYEADKEKLAPLGRRLVIEADLLPTRSILITPYDTLYKIESEDVALYFSLYRSNLYYPENESFQEMANKIMTLVIKNQYLKMKRIY